jgi:hypothetical protein
MKIGDNVVLRGTIKGVTYGEYGFPHYLVTLPNGCETEFPKPYIEDLQQLDEPQPIKVPQFVADWITHSKNIGCSLFGAMSIFEENFEIKKWMQWAENQETFAQAWIFGYEVEKESKYIVKVKATGQCLGKYYINNEILSPRFIYTGRHADSFTRKELEEADFSWVFDCDGVGVEEVE